CQTQVCTNGLCGVGCTGGLVKCGGVCRDLTSDPGNCGACGQPCAAGQTCVSGQCLAGLVCSAGFGNCDGNDANGCETPLNTVTNCGGCGNTCNQSNSSSALCNGVTCSYTCKPGFADCNSLAPDTDGCETSLGTTANCGACGNACGPGAA